MTIDVATNKPNAIRIRLSGCDVKKVEAERIICPAQDEGFETHYRTIRVTTTNGEVLELDLEAEDDQNLMVQEVEVLPPVKKRRVRRDKFDWLTPNVVKPHRKQG